MHWQCFWHIQICQLWVLPWSSFWQDYGILLSMQLDCKKIKEHHNHICHVIHLLLILSHKFEPVTHAIYLSINDFRICTLRLKHCWLYQLTFLCFILCLSCCCFVSCICLQISCDELIMEKWADENNDCHPSYKNAR